MIELLNPWLLGGLAAISAPVIIHLLHRRNAKRVDWGAMRFLLELMAQRRRRIFLDDFLLLLVRCLLVACIALAMVRPAIHKASTLGQGGGLSREGRTASVLLIDDSLSASAGRAQPTFESMKQLALAYLDSLVPGDEVSMLLMSQVGAPAADPIFDLEAAKAQLNSLKPSPVATHIPLLLEAGFAQLKRHVNPVAELVLVTDGRKDGWNISDKDLWEELRERFAGTTASPQAARHRPRLMVLAPPASGTDENVALTGITMDRTLVSAGHTAKARAQVTHFGKQNRQVTAELSVSGQVLGSSRLDLPAGERREAVFEHLFERPGSYALEARLLENFDLLPADDRRCLSLQVESGVAVLLIDDMMSRGLEGKLGFVAYALDPQQDERGPFRVSRITAAQLNPAALEQARVVVLGDVRALEPSMVDALERFVVAGGGILVGLGPDSDPALINQYWARQGDGFLPCPIGARTSPEKPALPAGMSFGHPVFSGFGSENEQAWRAARVRTFFTLQPDKRKPGELDPLLSLDTGDSLVVERRRGLGLVCLITTSLNADWTDLPVEAAFVPLVRGIVGRLGSFVMPPRNLLPGERFIYARVKDPTKAVSADGPSGQPIKLTLGAWEGRDSVYSEPLLEPGIHTLRTPDEPAPVHFAVSVSPQESALQPIDPRELKGVLPRDASWFQSGAELAAKLDPSRRQGVEAWRWLLGLAVCLVFVETWLPRRQTQ